MLDHGAIGANQIRSLTLAVYLRLVVALPTGFHPLSPVIRLSDEVPSLLKRKSKMSQRRSLVNAQFFAPSSDFSPVLSWFSRHSEITICNKTQRQNLKPLLKLMRNTFALKQKTNTCTAQNKKTIRGATDQRATNHQINTTMKTTYGTKIDKIISEQAGIALCVIGSEIVHIHTSDIIH